jgi:hypothetical protein
MADGSGYIIQEGHNVNVKSMAVELQSALEGWDIKLKGPESSPKRPRT